MQAAPITPELLVAAQLLINVVGWIVMLARRTWQQEISAKTIEEHGEHLDELSKSGQLKSEAFAVMASEVKDLRRRIELLENRRPRQLS